MSNGSSRRRAAPRRRHQVVPLSAPVAEIDIETFADALGEAAALLADLGRAFAGYVVSRTGRVLSGWALTGPHHQIEDVVLLVLAGDRPAPGTGVVLLSADPDDDLQKVQEGDEARWQSLRRVLAGRGYHLWDWVHADGDAFLSMHFATGWSGGWPAPPVALPRGAGPAVAIGSLATDEPEENHDHQ